MGWGKGPKGEHDLDIADLRLTLTFRERRKRNFISPPSHLVDASPLGPLDSRVQGPVTPVRDEARRGLRWRGSPWRRGGGAPHYFWDWEIWDFGWGGGPCLVLLIVMGIGMRGDGWNLG
jgi:hypothetical protein